YSWNVFDIAAKCECIGKCQSIEPCFREDHVEKYIDPETKEEKEKLIHRAYCGGRAIYADGWMPMNEIVKLWLRIRRNHQTFETEAMGSRPPSSGFVIRDRAAYQRNVVDTSPEFLFIPGAPVDICVDWGTVAASIEVWQQQYAWRDQDGVIHKDRHVLLYAELMREAGETQIFARIFELAARYKNVLRDIACDIGGGGNYLNKKLREEHRMPVRDVVFAEEKESAVAAWNIFNESGECVYPLEFEDFHEQTKKWKRVNGRIQKKDDHMCDSAVCYFARFIDELGIQKVRTVPVAFSTVGQAPRATAFTASTGRPMSITGKRLPPMARSPMAQAFKPGGRRTRP